MNKPIAYEAYQKLADIYAELAPTKDYNAYLDRPAILSLLDDLNGKKILDAGCGPGIYTEIFLNRGASVIGVDISENMLQHAEARNGNKATFIKANLEEPLRFISDGEIDGVVSALAVSYIRDLHTLFQEFNRILKKDGWFVFSTEHPLFSYNYFNIDNYFEVQPVSCEWNFRNNPVTMSSYFHNLGYVCSSLLENGYAIENIVEPKPTIEFKDQHPEGYEKRMKSPIFITFKARKIRAVCH